MATTTSIPARTSTPISTPNAQLTSMDIPIMRMRLMGINTDTAFYFSPFRLPDAGTPFMQRITVTLDDDLVEELDLFQKQRGYQNRSEALRDLTRAGLQLGREDDAKGACVAALVYVYDHETRALAKRLANAQHHHHDLSVATLHVHLDHDSCLEVAVLRGQRPEIRHFAEHVIAERGVRHGRLMVIPVDMSDETHEHGDGKGEKHAHAHVKQAG